MKNKNNETKKTEQLEELHLLSEQQVFELYNIVKDAIDYHYLGLISLDKNALKKYKCYSEKIANELTKRILE